MHTLKTTEQANTASESATASLGCKFSEANQKPSPVAQVESRGRGKPPIPGIAAQRLPALDGLRGVAILLVLLTHGMEWRNQPLGKGLNAFVNTGWIGIEIFFVLSGFLITCILLESRGSQGYYRVFYIRRALRIVPLYYAYCLILFWVFPHFVADPAQYSHRALWYFSFSVFAPLRFVGWPGVLPYSSFLWSLAVEEQFYSTWPFVVAHISPRGLRRLCGAMVIIAFAARVLVVQMGHPLGAYVLLPCRMGALAAGAWLATLYREGRVQLLPARLVFWCSVPCILAIVVLERSGWFLTTGMVTFGSVLVTLMCSGLLVMAIYGHRARALLLSPVLLFFAKYSYGLYVFNLMAVGIAYWLLGSAGSVPARTARLLCSLCIEVPLALCSWHLLEKRFLALQKHFPYGFVKRKQTRTPANKIQPSLVKVEASERALA